jgi:hypothetical protein
MRTNRSMRSETAEPEVIRGGPTTAQLRGEMPSRRTPGKSSAEHPAAVPFDTDDEAAGRPADREAIKLARLRQNAQLPVSLDPARGALDAATALIIVAAVVLAVIVGALYWALRSA